MAPAAPAAEKCCHVEGSSGEERGFVGHRGISMVLADPHGRAGSAAPASWPAGDGTG
jgi:hypothetical protein